MTASDHEHLQCSPLNPHGASVRWWRAAVFSSRVERTPRSRSLPVPLTPTQNLQPWEYLAHIVNRSVLRNEPLVGCYGYSLRWSEESIRTVSSTDSDNQNMNYEKSREKWTTLEGLVLYDRSCVSILYIYTHIKNYIYIIYIFNHPNICMSNSDVWNVKKLFAHKTSNFAST